MAKSLLLVDTDVLIDFSRGVEQSREQLRELEKNRVLAISVVTQLELMVGCENNRAFKSLQKFLDSFNILHLNSSISKQAVELFEEYRLSHGVLIPDMLIASTALTLEIALMSKNRKDFRFIDKLDLVKYQVS
ncbi:MAG TPA: type II toxin-antitoxin system VapC family toxin [Balneolaceae bacterium]|nr:type II toxin-antitoxin system VapC family toxin [Balneolaceae bacterium]